MNSRTNRQHDEAVEAAVADGERRYAESFDPEAFVDERRRCDLCGCACRQEQGDGEIVLDGKHLIVCEGCAVENSENLA